MPRVWAWVQEFRANVADDFFPEAFEDFLDNWLAQERAGQLSWAVYRDKELGGLVTFAPWSPWTGTAHCTFARRFWGHETTLPALREVAAQIFSRGYGKLSLMPFKSNSQMRALIKLLGAKQEGFLRDQTLQGGEPKGIAVYGLTRKDFEEVQDASGSSDSSVNQRGRSGGGRTDGEEGFPHANTDQHQHPDPIPGTPADPKPAGGPPDRAD